MTWLVLGSNAAAVCGLMLCLWVWSVYRRDASIVDPWWSMGFLLIALNTWRMASTPGSVWLVVMVGLWAVRLWLHLLLRARGKPEDPRYQNFRRQFGEQRYWWVSLFQVFLLQGTLMLLISAPLQIALTAPQTGAWAWNELIGTALFAVGFLFESLADWQLQRFRNDARLRGSVLDSGLWRFSRHPNYFGEAVLWWGFWLFALGAPLGIYAVASPALMTFLLLRVSGVAMLERQLEKTKPPYQAYVRRTSAFVPWPKKPE